jgi:FkbM family methyltransferase
MKSLLKLICTYLLDNNIFFSGIISMKHSLVYLVKNHRDFIYNPNNQFYNSKIVLNTAYNIDRKIFTKGFYDIKTLFLLKLFLKNGDVFLDIGANIGSISFAARKIVGDQGKVICFEPGPLLYKSLSKSVIENKYLNFELFNYGCSNKEGFLHWIFDKSNPGNALLSDYGDIEVKVVKLDNILPVNKHIDFIKIDVEGMELLVLQGAEMLIKSNLPMILIETNTDTEGDLKSTKATLEYVSNFGYTFFCVKNNESTLGLNFMNKVDLVNVSFPEVPQNTLAIPNIKLEKYGLVKKSRFS